MRSGCSSSAAQRETASRKQGTDSSAAPRASSSWPRRSAASGEEAAELFRLEDTGDDLAVFDAELERVRAEADKLREENRFLNKYIEDLKEEIRSLNDMHLQMQLFIPEEETAE